MKIIGFRAMSFQTKDNPPVLISGSSIYITEPIENGVGLSAEKIFLSSDKLNAMSFKLSIGLDIPINYNRWGKVTSLTLINEEFVDM